MFEFNRLAVIIIFFAFDIFVELKNREVNVKLLNLYRISSFIAMIVALITITINSFSAHTGPKIAPILLFTFSILLLGRLLLSSTDKKFPFMFNLKWSIIIASIFILYSISPYSNSTLWAIIRFFS